MYKINWDKFNLKNPDKEDAFERMCRHLFMREFKISGYDFTANYNQAGLETEPVKYEGRYIGFQCKYSTSDNSTSFYKQLYKSLKKAFAIYTGRLDDVYIYTNLNIKPKCTKEELGNSKNKSDRIKIQREAKDLGINLHWIKEENFAELLNELGNIDIYRFFFSQQNEFAYMDSNITIDERTFLKSDLFIELKLNGKDFNVIKNIICENPIGVIVGGAGTGKTQIMKKIYLNCSEDFIENYSKESYSEVKAIPVFISLKESIYGDLENLIRGRLRDYNFSFVCNQKFNYYFDGLDEVSIDDIGNIITTIKLLNERKSTGSILISSRNSSYNLIFLQRAIDLKTYKIEPLDKNYIDLYFEKKRDKNKLGYLKKIKDDNLDLLYEIEDIFSINLLWNNIENINKETTKIDLIKQTASQIINTQNKLINLNIPEPKFQGIIKILMDTSLQLQKNRTLSISVTDFQKIVKKRYLELTYKEIDSIIYVIAEMFFDIASGEKASTIYSFKHRRYHEYFLYKQISHSFYQDPFILRELDLLTDKDFVLNIFMLQELKESVTEKNLIKNLSLRFLEAYLGDEYCQGFENKFMGNQFRFGVGSESYLESEILLDYLCTKNEAEIGLWFDNQGVVTSEFLTSNNYWKFIKKYFISQNRDIRGFLDNFYNFDVEFLENARNSEPCAYWYCKCVLDQASYNEVFDKSISSISLNKIESELDFINPYTSNNTSICVGFYEIGIELYKDELSEIVLNLTETQLEVLCFALLKPFNINTLYGESNKSKKFRTAIVKAIHENEGTTHKLNTTIVYYLITNKVFLNKEVLEENFTKVNINHYRTWERNLNANSYCAIILEKEKQLCSKEYALSILIRKTIIDNYPQNKLKIIDTILTCIKNFNLIYDNWFSYDNSNFIGEIISQLEFDVDSVKRLIYELTYYPSVISLTVVLYKIFINKRSLFKIVTNVKMLKNMYSKSCLELSYYDHNTDHDFMYATMFSCFDISYSDKFFLKALNKSFFRPAFRNEDLISAILPECIFRACQNNWYDYAEMETLIARVYSMLLVMKETTDSGGNIEILKAVIEKYLPNSQLLDELYNVEASKIFEQRDTNTKETRLPDGISLQNIREYYRCKIEGINYRDINSWKYLISVEHEEDKELHILYDELKNYNFPEMYSGGMNEYFHVISAVLLENNDTKEKFVNFLLEQGGRTALLNILKAYSFVGEDELARNCIEQLFILSEALVYPNYEYYMKYQYKPSELKRIILIIQDSVKNDWLVNEEYQEMVFIKDPSIRIKWADSDRGFTINEKWAICHPDRNAYEVKYNIIFKDTVIERFTLVHIDGNRAAVPYPKAGANIITRKEYNYSLLFNDMKNLNEYIRHSHLIVE